MDEQLREWPGGMAGVDQELIPPHTYGPSPLILSVEGLSVVRLMCHPPFSWPLLPIRSDTPNSRGFSAGHEGEVNLSVGKFGRLGRLGSR
jgi:hypothetical protein